MTTQSTARGTALHTTQRLLRTLLLLWLPLGDFGSSTAAAERLVQRIGKISPRVMDDSDRRQAQGAIDRDLRRRRAAANRRDREQWEQLTTREQWESFRDIRLRKLRASLGQLPEPGRPPTTHLTGVVQGDGCRIVNVLYESRPGDWVAGNLYLPARSGASMPGILIAHAHHRPKHQSELQDMGMTWARAGCVVLVIDQVGYGERRSHPFDSEDDYAKSFRVSRQDYYHRYDTGIQLQLTGDSLLGWMAGDHIRGVDLLLSQRGVDPNRIIMLGAVAGGGDPCGVTAALDSRIDAAVPFNFGGPQPETQYPLPEDAETSFNYMMSSYWDSTRGLRRTAPDEFFHWLIVGAIAPRGLIYSHEFSWDRERDPVWSRLERIYGDFYDAADHLAAAHGKGSLRGRPPEASHCTNIGRFHRKMIHPALRQWFDIDVTEADEFSDPKDLDALTCMTAKARQGLQPTGFVERVAAQGARRAAAARAALSELAADARRPELQRQWRDLLGELQAPPPTVIASEAELATVLDGAGRPTEGVLRIDRVVLEVEPDVVAPLILISADPAKDAPVVVGLAQAGKEGFLAHRAAEIAACLERGAIVCLPDLRGTGEIRAGASRGRSSGDGNRSVNLLMFDQTMVGQRLRDLRSVLTYLRGRADVDPERISLWGDSFAKTNSTETDFQVPRGVDGRPLLSEPLGGMLALLGALMDDRIEGVYVHRGLTSCESVLQHFAVHIPHDVVVPGMLTAGDLGDVAAALAPRRLALADLVTGRNLPATRAEVAAAYAPAAAGYRDAGAERRVDLHSKASPAEWLLPGGGE